MKYLILITILFTTTNSFAADTVMYICNMRDVTTGQYLAGSSYKVITDDDAKTASVYSTVVYPRAQPTLTATLQAETNTDTLEIVTRYSNQNSGVSFSRETEQTGALSFINKNSVSTFLCSAVN